MTTPIVQAANTRQSRVDAIDRRSAVKALAIAVVGTPAILRGRYRLFAQTPQEYSARAVRLMNEAVVVDMLNQFRRGPQVSLQRWVSQPASFTKSDFEPYRTSGMKVFAFGGNFPSYDVAASVFAAVNAFIASHPEWLLRIDDRDALTRVRGSDRVGLLVSTQNSAHFRTEDDVDTFFGLGQRGSQLTYNTTNRLGSGFLADEDSGLTPFGRSVVERMNRVGMAVDVSHCGDRTTLDALDAARKPVLFTHASCRALVPGHLRARQTR